MVALVMTTRDISFLVNIYRLKLHFGYGVRLKTVFDRLKVCLLRK
jgi:hypothetical protein